MTENNGLLPSPPIIAPPVFHDKKEKDNKVPSEVRTGFSTFSPTTSITTPQQQNCEICHKKNRGEEMLLCDGCDCGRLQPMFVDAIPSSSLHFPGFHMFCLDPP